MWLFWENRQVQLSYQYSTEARVRESICPCGSKLCVREAVQTMPVNKFSGCLSIRCMLFFFLFSRFVERYVVLLFFRAARLCLAIERGQ